jgi:type VI secretion system ImpC/EvpB family protein
MDTRTAEAWTYRLPSPHLPSRESLPSHDEPLEFPLPGHAGSRGQLARRLTRQIAAIDRLLNRQVNAILHHPALQRLEAAWRGLHFLVRQVPEGENVKVRILNVSWRELARDLDRALEFDQSQLFRKVYSEEFGTPGGEPFSVLLGDYEIQSRPGPGHPTDDVATLERIASVAAAAFCPFVAAAHPELLDLDSFTELELQLDLARTFEQRVYLKWRAFRESEDARFVGLTLPRVLLRLPYADDNHRADGFRFQETVGHPARADYLWGNAAFAFGAVLVREFAATGWLAGIRGFRRGEQGAGVVGGLPVPHFATERRGVAPTCATEVLVTDAQEKELGELGFLPLCHRPGTAVAVFHGNPSVQKPRLYDARPATVNARLSAMLQYMLCVARFAHYVKVLARDRLGSFTGAADCARQLNDWLRNYVSANEDAGPELKAKYPLREANVEVRARPDNPGVYLGVIHLRPHLQFDQIVTAVKLVTEIGAPNPRSSSPTRRAPTRTAPNTRWTSSRTRAASATSPPGSTGTSSAPASGPRATTTSRRPQRTSRPRARRPCRCPTASDTSATTTPASTGRRATAAT